MLNEKFENTNARTAAPAANVNGEVDWQAQGKVS